MGVPIFKKDTNTGFEKIVSTVMVSKATRMDTIIKKSKIGTKKLILR